MCHFWLTLTVILFIIIKPVKMYAYFILSRYQTCPLILFDDMFVSNFSLN